MLFEYIGSACLYISGPLKLIIMKKPVIAIIILLAILLSFAWIAVTFFPEQLVPFIINNQIDRSNRNSTLLSDKDNKMVVFTIGTGTPMPGKRAQSGTAMFVNGHFFLFDAGAGVVQGSENIGLPLDQLDAVFITHWHSDHYMDLPNLVSRSWILGRNDNLPVYAPGGVDTIVDAVNQFLLTDNQYRVDHHGKDIMNITKSKAIAHHFSIGKRGKGVVFDQDGIKITAFAVNHAPVEPAVGYAIEYMGKKVVISGDTKKNALVQEMAQKADLLIHEAMLMSVYKEMAAALEQHHMDRNGKIITDIQEYHTSPYELAALAEAAHVKKLVLYHLAPAPDNILIRNIYRKLLKAYKGETHLANDGDKFVVD